ncbi:MAG: hypothetical protein WCA89_11185 [Terracidiphilus sp.]
METTTSIALASDSAPEAVLMKTDCLGRVKHTAEQREKILDEFERGGLSGASYAALVGVKYQTFATWAQARKRGRPTYPKRRPRAQNGQVKWLEAVVPPPASVGSTGLLLHLPGGVRVELASHEQVALAAALVRALDKPC